MMAGAVIIRTPWEMRIIHRDRLASVRVDASLVTWRHVGEGEASFRMDSDELAKTLFESITSEQFCMQNVAWLWDSDKQWWTATSAALPVDNTELRREEEFFGFGSLGR